MDKELNDIETRDSLAEIENLRIDLLTFAEFAKQDPALANMGVNFTFADDLKAFENRAKASINKLEKLLSEISGQQSSRTTATQQFRSFIALAKDIKSDLEWLHEIQSHLNLMILSSSQDLPQWFIAEMSRYLESIFEQIKSIVAHLIEQYGSKLAQNSHKLWDEVIKQASLLAERGISATRARAI
jgi:hypothetical protein